jgi:hypothetical protein
MPPPRLHLSVDDVVDCLRDLAEGSYASPWAQPVLGELRRLHEETGAVVSLYAFVRAEGWQLGRVPDRHQDAFAAAAPWLRFGFHGLDEATDYGVGGVPVASARAHHRRFVAEVGRFAGEASIDRVPRVHRFRGRRGAVRAWREGPHGVRGLLTADDDRPEVYHLDAALRRRVRREGAVHDAREGLALVASLPRLEGLGDVAGRLDRAVDEGWAQGGLPLCVFTHEPFLADPVVRGRLGDALAWARRAGADFAFPADVIGDAQPSASRSAS